MSPFALPRLPSPSNLPSLPRLPDPRPRLVDLGTSLSRLRAPSLALPAAVGRRHRRAAAHEGLAHIEIRGAHDERVAAAVETSLQSLDGVHWAAVHPRSHRVVIAYDHERIAVDHLVTAIQAVERGAKVEGERFAHDLAEHPLDGASVRGATIALAADGVAMSLSLAGVVLRVSRIPIEAAALVSVVGEHPRFRRMLAERIGPLPTDLGLAAANAFGLALAHGPFGISIDALHRVNLLTAARSTAASWAARQHDLVPSAEAIERDQIDATERPQRRPGSTVETYADRAALASVATGAAALVATASPRRAGAMLVAAAPKPARLGHEMWAGQLERILARRSTVVLDREVLRRLDLVDTVLLDADVVVRSIWRPDRVVVAPGHPVSKVQKRLRALFDPDDPRALRTAGRWTVGPVDRLGTDAPRGLVGPARDPAGGPLLGVRRDDEIVALFVAAPVLHDGTHALVDATRQADLRLLVAADDELLADRLHADGSIARAPSLEDAVRRLQGDGQVVALVASDGDAALAAADVGIAVVPTAIAAAGPVRFPAGAHLLVPDLDEARFVIEAGAVAQEVTRQANAISLASVSLGSLLALTAPAWRAGHRAATAVNLGTIAAMANGIRAAVQLDRQPDLPAVEDEPRWHELPRAEVLELLATSKSGLSAATAAERSRRPRPLPPQPVRLVAAMVGELANPLTPVLAGSALVAASVGSAIDAAIVASVVGLNGVISGTQRFLAEEAIRSMARAGATPAHVRRDGELTTVDASELVPGDVIVLEAGDTVPADGRLLRARLLDVDESSLTGESEPVRKGTAATFSSQLTERDSMVFAGTAVASGQAEAVVVAVGTDTVAAAPGNGRAVADVGSVDGVETRLRDLSRISIPVAAGAGIVVTAAQVLRGTSLRRALPGGISLAVAAVPEGLPMLATVGQLAAARRLSQREVLVRNPRAIEALGRTEVLCVDKTGTLTEGRIELRGVSDTTTVRLIGASPPLGAQHHRILAAARRATPTPDARTLPHYTDRAIVDAAAREGVDETFGATRWERGPELPFTPDRAFHATWGGAKQAVLSVKGAPEVLLDRCAKVRRAGKALPIDRATRAELDEHVTELARRGMRILAVAERRTRRPVPESVDDVHDDDVDGLVLLGFLALADPVRHTSAEAIRGLREAGVELVMVTGDHPSTAEGIAVELGILNGRQVMNGADLDRMTDDALDGILDEVSVFARVTPAHKVRIVEAYQRSGRAVAMTGDGANDANAMRLADAGIAIGHRATASARGAADVIIADDHIETVVDGIIEGRALWASVRDGLALLLGGNLGEIGFMLAAGGIGGRPALSTRQVLMVNLLTDVVPALAIVARPPASRTPSDLAAEGPDRSLGTQLTKAIATRAAATATGATAAWMGGRVTGRAQRASTMGFTALVGTQLAQTLAARWRDPVVVGSALGSAAVLLAVVETPGVSQFFGCTPLGPVALSTVVVSSASAAVGAAVAPGLVDVVADRLAALVPGER